LQTGQASEGTVSSTGIVVAGVSRGKGAAEVAVVWWWPSLLPCTVASPVGFRLCTLWSVIAPSEVPLRSWTIPSAVAAALVAGEPPDGFLWCWFLLEADLPFLVFGGDAKATGTGGWVSWVGEGVQLLLVFGGKMRFGEIPEGREIDDGRVRVSEWRLVDDGRRKEFGVEVTELTVLTAEFTAKFMTAIANCPESLDADFLADIIKGAVAVLAAGADVGWPPVVGKLNTNSNSLEAAAAAATVTPPFTRPLTSTCSNSP